MMKTQDDMFNQKKQSQVVKAVKSQEEARSKNLQDIIPQEKPSQDEKAASKPHVPQTIDERISSAFYIPVHSSKDDSEVWQEVMKVFDEMPEHDYVEDADKKFDAHSCKYSMNNYMLAHTRLCRLKNDDQLLIELRRLEGDGFTFHDEYRKNLQQKFKQPTPAVEKEAPEYMYLDLSDPSSAEMIETWLDDLLPEEDLVYNQSRCYSALSTLGWNLKDETNYKVLSKHREKIIERCINVLRHVDHLATIYFAALTLSQYAAHHELGSLDWEKLAVLCGQITEWCGEKKGDISRSREVIRLLMSVLDVAGTPDSKPSKPLKRKIGKMFEKSLEFAKLEKQQAVLKEKYSACF